MKEKKKLIITTVIVLIVMIATIGITFAMFMYSETGETSKLVLGDIWMKYTEKEGISLQNAMPGDPYSDYFEFTITGTNTYEKKDIWYDVILSNGSVPDGKLEENRIDSKYLKFRLVEVNGEEETVIFTDRNYDNLNNRRVYVSTIPKNTIGEYNKTYRMYMTLSENLAIGNTEDSVMTMEDFENVFASVKVSVTGDFNEKLIYTDASCFTTEVINTYTHNTNMTDEEINKCVTYLTNQWGVEEIGNTVDEGETYEDFCRGTGTNWGYTFQENLDNNRFSDEKLTYFEENNNIINNGESLAIIDYDVSCGTDVVIPKKINGFDVVLIGKNTFYNKQLTSVVIPNSVTSIGEQAFEANQLTSVEIPDSVTTIGAAVFYSNNLTSVEIPNSVKVIGGGAFAENQLSSVTFEENSILTSIGSGAFRGENHTISEVTIPDTVTELYCDSFNDDVTIHKNESLVCKNAGGPV